MVQVTHGFLQPSCWRSCKFSGSTVRGFRKACSTAFKDLLAWEHSRTWVVVSHPRKFGTVSRQGIQPKKVWEMSSMKNSSSKRDNIRSKNMFSIQRIRSFVSLKQVLVCFLWSEGLCSTKGLGRKGGLGPFELGVPKPPKLAKWNHISPQ